jgi:hypothetical protein
VLLANVADRDLPAVTVLDGNTKDCLGKEYALCVVTECAMAEVGKERLRLIEPVVDDQVIFRPAAKSSCAAFCVLQRVGHGYTSMLEVV